ncbi:MAG: hypothetical protein WB867_10275 [Candidatus Dormiibacterota bacterium]
MAARRDTRRVQARLLIALVGASIVCVPMMAWIVLHNFAFFDDEGYYLLTLAGIAHHHSLYTQIYGTYGPAYYVLYLAAFWLLHLPFTPDAARLMTVVLWATCCLLSGLLVWRACGSIALAFGAVFVSYRWLVGVGTTGELYAAFLIIPLQLVLAMTLPGALAHRQRSALMICGALIGSILLIKVNVGIFTLVAVGVVAAGTGIGGLTIPRWLRWTTWALALAIPFALVLALVHHSWVQEYLAGSEAAVGALLISTRAGGRLPTSGLSMSSSFTWLAGGALGASLWYVLAVAHAGTSVATILNSTFVVPLSQTHAFVAPIPIDGLEAATMAIVALYSSVLVWRCRIGGSGRTPRLLAILGITKVAAGAAIILWGITGDFSLGPAFGAACMAVAGFSSQPDGLHPRRQELIWLVAAFGVFQQLQMYPVAGVQVASGTLWFGLAGLIMADDGLRLLARRGIRVEGSTPQTGVPGLSIYRTLAAAIVVAILASQAAITLANSPTDTVSLGLRGSSWIYLARPQVKVLQSVTRYLQNECSTFISAPGFDSLYTWAGEQPPLGLLVDDWMYLISAREQEAVLRKLQYRPGVCGVVNPGLIRFWEHGTSLPSEPILNALAREFVRVRRYGGFEILRRRLTAG